MSVIPIISSAADLPGAIKHASRVQGARWYVAKRAHALGLGDRIPKEWGITASFGGDWSAEPRDTSDSPALTRRHKASKMGRMTRPVTAAAGDDFNRLHPRDRNGRFIEKLDLINIFSVSGGTTVAGRGVAVGARKNPTSGVDEIEVEVDRGKHGKKKQWVPVDRIESAPPAKATLDGPAADAPADAPETPEEAVSGPDEALDDKAKARAAEWPVGTEVETDVYGINDQKQTVRGKVVRHDKRGNPIVDASESGHGELAPERSKLRRVESADGGGTVGPSGYTPTTEAKIRARYEGMTDQELVDEYQLARDDEQYFLKNGGITDAQFNKNEFRTDTLRDELDKRGLDNKAARKGELKKTGDEQGDQLPSPIDDSADDLADRLTEAGHDVEDMRGDPFQLKSYAESVGFDISPDGTVGDDDSVTLEDDPDYQADVAGDEGPATPDQMRDFLREKGYSDEVVDDLTTEELVSDYEAEGGPNVPDLAVFGDDEDEEYGDLDEVDQGPDQLASNDFGTYEDQNPEPVDPDSVIGESPDPSEIGSGTLDRVDDGGIGLSGNALEDLDAVRELFDVDTNRGGWASGMNDTQFESLRLEVDDWLEDPESVPAWADEKLSDIAEFAEAYGITDLTDVIDLRRQEMHLGWAQSEQLNNIMRGESLDSQNPAALSNIADFLRNNPLTYHNFNRDNDDSAITMAELAGDINQFLDGAYEGPQDASAIRYDGSDGDRANFRSLIDEELRSRGDSGLDDWEGTADDEIDAGYDGKSSPKDVVDAMMSDDGDADFGPKQSGMFDEALEEGEDITPDEGAAPADNREDYWKGFSTGSFKDYEPEDQAGLREAFDRAIDEQGMDPLDALESLQPLRLAALDRRAKRDAIEDGDGPNSYLSGLLNGAESSWGATDADKLRVRDAFESGWNEQGPQLGLERAAAVRQEIIDERNANTAKTSPDYWAGALGLDTLETRNSDDLDFHEVNLETLRDLAKQIDPEAADPADHPATRDAVQTALSKGGSAADFPEFAVWSLKEYLENPAGSDDDAPSGSEKAPESASDSDAGAPAPSGGGDPEAAKKLLLLVQSANKDSTPLTPGETNSRLNEEVLNAENPDTAHKNLAKLMTELKLGGKQRKRYREFLDEYLGSSGGDSAKTQAAATAENLSDSNPVKERLAKKAAEKGSASFPKSGDGILDYDSMPAGTRVRRGDDVLIKKDNGKWTREKDGGDIPSGTLDIWSKDKAKGRYEVESGTPEAAGDWKDRYEVRKNPSPAGSAYSGQSPTPWEVVDLRTGGVVDRFTTKSEATSGAKAMHAEDQADAPAATSDPASDAPAADAPDITSMVDGMVNEYGEPVKGAKLPAGVKKVKTTPVSLSSYSNSYRVKDNAPASEITLNGKKIGTIQRGSVGGSVMNGKHSVGWSAESTGWLALDENDQPIRGVGLTAKTAQEAIALLLLNQRNDDGPRHALESSEGYSARLKRAKKAAAPAAPAAPATPDPASMSDGDLSAATKVESDRTFDLAWKIKKAPTGPEHDAQIGEWRREKEAADKRLEVLLEERTRRRRASLLRGEGPSHTISTPAGPIRAGDIVQYESRDGSSSLMLVESVTDDVKHGEAGFDGVLVDANGVPVKDQWGREDSRWGYSDQARFMHKKAPSGKA